MNGIHEPNEVGLRIAENQSNFEQLLAQLRQDQLEAALVGRMAESAFYAAEAKALRVEYAQADAVCS